MADDIAAVLAVLARRRVTNTFRIRPSSLINDAVLAVHNSELDYFIIPPLFSLVSFAPAFYICLSCNNIFYVRFLRSLCIVINILLIYTILNDIVLFLHEKGAKEDAPGHEMIVYVCMYMYMGVL